MPRIAHAALAAVLLAPAVAGAHGVRHEAEIEGGSVAVRVLHHGAKPLADARYSVFPPGPGDRARETGRTDRHGWLVFDPDVAGTWRVKVADASGHGTTVEVEVPPRAIARADASLAAAAGPSSGPPAPPPGAVPPAPGPRADAPPAAPSGDEPGPARVLAGAGALALAFLALFAVQRRRRAAGR